MEGNKSISNITEAELHAILAKIQAKKQELGLDKVDIELSSQLIFNGKVPQGHAFFQAQGFVSPTLQEKLNEFNQFVKAELASYGPEAFNNAVEVGIGLGDKFPTLENLKVLFSGETKAFSCPEGEVVLVDFWATWCGPCQKPMAHNQEMLEKNEEKWKGKARIVAISLDDEAKDADERVESKNWKKIENYQAPGGFESPASTQFGINGIPTVLLVDKAGNIVFRGHPSELDLEAKINDLIEGKEEQKAEPKAEEGKAQTKEISLEEEKALFEKFRALIDSKPQEVESIPRLGAGLWTKRLFKKDKPEFTGRFLISGMVTDKNKNILKGFYDKLKEVIPKDFKVDKRVFKVDSQEIKYGTECGTCSKPLSKDVAHYVCTGCQSEGEAKNTFCLDCADKEMATDLNGPKELFHPHALLYVDKNSEAAFEKMARLFNYSELIPEDLPNMDAIKQDASCNAFCDACQNNQRIKKYRWACGNCANFDLCTDCFKISKDPTHEKHAQLEESLKKMGHDAKTHSLYRGHYMVAMGIKDPEPFDIDA